MIFFILILYFAYWIHFYIYILQHFETNLKCLILSLSPSLCSFLCILVYAKDKKKKKRPIDMGIIETELGIKKK